MKKLLLLLSFPMLLLTSCAGGDAEIDKTAQDFKKIIEEVGGKAEKVIDKVDEKMQNKEETISTFKGLVDDLAKKAKEVNKIIKEDTAFVEKIKGATKNLEKTIKEIEGVIQEDAKKEKLEQ